MFGTILQRPPRLLGVAALFLATILPASSGNAQTLTGRVLDEGTDWPSGLMDKVDLDRATEMEDDEAADALMKATRKRIKQQTLAERRRLYYEQKVA